MKSVCWSFKLIENICIHLGEWMNEWQMSLCHIGFGDRSSFICSFFLQGLRWWRPTAYPSVPQWELPESRMAGCGRSLSCEIPSLARSRRFTNLPPEYTTPEATRSIYSWLELCVRANSFGQSYEAVLVWLCFINLSLGVHGVSSFPLPQFIYLMKTCIEPVVFISAPPVCVHLSMKQTGNKRCRFTHFVSPAGWGAPGEFACSSRACVGSLRVLQLPPTDQKHAAQVNRWFQIPRKYELITQKQFNQCYLNKYTFDWNFKISR